MTAPSMSYLPSKAEVQTQYTSTQTKGWAALFSKVLLLNTVKSERGFWQLLCYEGEHNQETKVLKVTLSRVPPKRSLH